MRKRQSPLLSKKRQQSRSYNQQGKKPRRKTLSSNKRQDSGAYGRFQAQPAKRQQNKRPSYRNQANKASAPKTNQAQNKTKRPILSKKAIASNKPYGRFQAQPAKRRQNKRPSYRNQANKASAPKINQAQNKAKRPLSRKKAFASNKPYGRFQAQPAKRRQNKRPSHRNQANKASAPKTNQAQNKTKRPILSKKAFASNKPPAKTSPKSLFRAKRPLPQISPKRHFRSQRPLPQTSQLKPSPQRQSGALRLNKFLALHAGLSRRKADEMISQGQVFVNGEKILQAACFVSEKKDTVRVNKKPVAFKPQSFLYFMLNKPRKILCSAKDPKGRPLVTQFIKPQRGVRLFPAGRLDWDSEGLIILTNDGEFTEKLLHPRDKIAKIYLVKLKGRPKPSDLQKLIKGVRLPEGKKRAVLAKSLKNNSASAWIKIIITEGKKRQIRRMMEQVGLPVLQLKRTGLGRLKLNKLAPGAYVRLTEKDIQKVFQKPKELSYKKSKARGFRK